MLADRRTATGKDRAARLHRSDEAGRRRRWQRPMGTGLSIDQGERSAALLRKRSEPKLDSSGRANAPIAQHTQQAATAAAAGAQDSW